MSFIHDAAARSRFAAAKMQKVNLCEDADLFCDLYCLEPGQSQAVHSHADATKIYYVLDGTVEITIGQRREKVAAGGLAWAERNEPHGVENTSQARSTLLVIMAPHPNFRQ
jgi:quercetin dioxygenase-like cupin family protein